MLGILKKIANRMGIYPRTTVHRWLTYPRFLGTIKPQLLQCSQEEFEARLHSFQAGWQPAHISCPIGKRILVISPHPDDESIGAGGILLRHRGLADVHLVTVFNGDRGGALAEGPWQDDATYRKTLVEARRQELAKTATVLGAKSVQNIGVPDTLVEPTKELAERLGGIVEEIRPDAVLIPWYIDRLLDHRVTNVLFAWGCADLPTTVYAYEVWTQLQPNAILDISDVLTEKIELIRHYESQIRTVDYVSYAKSLAQVRAFQFPVRPNRGGAVEAFWAMPNKDYCELVRAFFGEPGSLKRPVRLVP